jgi:alpha/beta superfamily hydrolase
MVSSAALENTVVETIRFMAGQYRLEGELLYPESARPIGAVVMANPHPLLGGDMRNNVVRGLTNGLAARGLVALRFNYRGVGNSEGPQVDVAAQMARFWETSHVSSEDDLHFDLESAIDFLLDVVPLGIPVAAVGYSFGCSLLPRVKSLEELDSLVLVAPTVAKHDYQSFLTIDKPILVIAPQDDFATGSDTLWQWYDRQQAPKQLIPTCLDNHFYRGHEAWLTDRVFAFLNVRREVASDAERR